ncbi:hypothetical protein LTR85_001837 [Meristemomyces frigidus]|nr:hypothetical protein LTR85_001837 [Meristemomyces frigidus]
MDNSPLSTLPAELRDVMYELALHSEDAVVLQWHPDLGGFRACSSAGLPIPIRLALTETCKQTRSECLQLFYTSNTFELRLGEKVDERTFAERCTVMNRDPNPQYGHMVDTFFTSIGSATEAAITRLNVDLGMLSNNQGFAQFVMAVEQLEPRMLAHAELSIKIKGTCWRLFWVEPENATIELDLRDMEATCDSAIAKINAAPYVGGPRAAEARALRYCIASCKNAHVRRRSLAVNN